MIKQILNIARGTTIITTLSGLILGGSYGIGGVYADAWRTAERAHDNGHVLARDASNALMDDARHIEAQLVAIQDAISEARNSETASNTDVVNDVITEAETVVDQAGIIIRQQVSFMSRAKAATEKRIRDADPYFIWELNEAAAAFEQNARFTAEAHETMLDRVAELSLDAIPARIADTVTAEEERIAREEAERKAKEEAERRAREQAEYDAAQQQWDVPANDGGGWEWAEPAAQPPAPATQNHGGGQPGRAHAEALVRQYTGLPVIWNADNCSGGHNLCGLVTIGAPTAVHLSPETYDHYWLEPVGTYIIMHEIAHAILGTPHMLQKAGALGWTTEQVYGIQEHAADCYAARYASVAPAYGCTPEAQRYLSDLGV